MGIKEDAIEIAKLAIPGAKLVEELHDLGKSVKTAEQNSGGNCSRYTSREIADARNLARKLEDLGFEIRYFMRGPQRNIPAMRREHIPNQTARMQLHIRNI
jgi:hypothetical protein